MPTYAAMYAGYQEADGDDGEEFSQENVMRTPDRRSSDREGPSSAERQSVGGAGRGKGVGSEVNTPERYHIASEPGHSSDSAWEKASQDSWWSSWSSSRENWSWVDHHGSWKAYYGRSNPNWERVSHHDAWAAWHRGREGERWGVSHEHDHLECHGHPRGEVRRSGEVQGDCGSGEPDPTSPVSMPAARDVSGSLPSGEVSAAGHDKDRKVAGDLKPGKISSSYPPVFRAKPGESFKEWKRSVGFWLGGEAGSLPAELIGPRLMVQLRDRAGQLVHHLTNEDVNKPNGMSLVMSTLEKSPLIRQLDKHRVDLHRKRLMSLKRLPHESIESYVTRGQLYRTQLVALDDAMQMGECFFTGHLLDGARLSRKDKIMIKTKAGSETEEAVTNAMVELSPELEGDVGYPIGSSEPNAAARHGEEFLVQRETVNKFGQRKEVNAVEFDYPFAEDMPDLDEEEPLGEMDDNEPPELVQAAHEAFALHHKAKQRIMEIKKLRQYFKKPDADERKKLLQEKMRTSPCHRCGELGHWSRECPQRANGTGVTSTASSSLKPSGPARPNVEDEWSTLVSLCKPNASSPAMYKERFVGMVQPAEQVIFGVDWSPNQALWCSRELHLRVIVDLGCVKSVVGVDWMNELIQEWQSQGRWFRIQEEEETFQFGNGESLKSRFSVQFLCMIANCWVILTMSVVKGKCPPLLSRQACSQLGLRIDCATHSFSSTRMGVKNFGMSQASNGHYLLPICQYDVSCEVEVPEDFCMPTGMEAVVFQPASSQGRSDQLPAATMFEAVADRGVDCPPAPSCSPDVILSEQRHGVAASRGVQAVQREGPSGATLPHAGGVGPERPGTRDVSGCGLSRFDAESHCRQDSPQAADPTSGACHGVHRDAFDYGLGRGFRAHGRGDPDHQQTPTEDGGEPKQTRDPESPDGRGSGLSQSVPCVVSGGGPQHGVCDGFEDENLLVEKDVVATPGKGSGGEDDRLSLEAQPSLAGQAPSQGDSSSVGPLWGATSTPQRPGCVASDVKGLGLRQLQRGDAQRLKRGALLGRKQATLVAKTAEMEGKYVLLEIYAGTAKLTRLANEMYKDRWRALPPIDILYGHDLTKKNVQDEIYNMVVEEHPDLVTLSMPCGPWCQWMHLCDPDIVEEKRAADLPLWRFARRVWDLQVSRNALALTENPLGSDGLKLTFMEDRPSLFRARIAQCMLGLCDAVSGMPHRKMTALDVTNLHLALALEEGAKCTHEPEEHQPIEGTVKLGGEWWSRSFLAGAWPSKMCAHILKCAEKILQRIQPVPHWSLPEPDGPDALWEGPFEVNVVSSSMVPEETLRRELQSMGVAGDRYGYITFDGEGQQVPRRIRAAVAHLHATLGHLANERLVRMLLLSGAGEEILKAARNLRCQVCAMVQPPRDAPQAAYGKPQNFNTRVSGDTFFVWDSKNVKYGVVHFVDELTDYHVADCATRVDSVFAASVLRDQWYGVFGPPDVLLTDGGMEFAGAVETLNDLMGVLHEQVPEGAKWRLGHGERHGSILKLMLLKMMRGMSLDGCDDMRMAVTAACAAKNRLCNHGGISPLQAVTGRNAVIPASLMTQICSGKMKFVLNQDLDREECLRRAERIRQGAIESFHWIDSHQTLRRALASKSRPPKLEMVQEGAVVYIYDPPAKRRGLARRLQDNVSWHGPAVVVCVERDRRVPGRVWVRIKGRVKAVPLEKLRLATTEELVSAHYITEALDEVHKELTSGRMQVEETPALEDGEVAPAVEGTAAVLPSSDSEMEKSSSTEDQGEDRETERMRLEKRLLHDVPLQFQAPAGSQAAGSQAAPSTPAGEPHALPFPKKQKLFENLAKSLQPPTPFQEMRVREQLEKAYDNMKLVRKTLKTPKARPKATPGVVAQRRPPREAHATDLDPERIEIIIEDYVTEQQRALETYVEDEHNSMDDDVVMSFDDPPEYKPTDSLIPNEVLALETVIENINQGTANYGQDVTEVLQQHVLWTEPSAAAKAAELETNLQEHLRKDQEVLDGANLVTGKDRVEYTWSKLDAAWKEAFIEPIVDGFKVYFDHQALQGVPEGQWVEPRRILPSRMVLTNKGGKDLASAKLKARWVFGGHRDPDAGQYPTSSPTVSLVGHNLLNFVAVQKGWVVAYEDVSAAFLQGQELPEGREIYVRIPQGYPLEAMSKLREMIGPNMRDDLVKLVKGGFGLPESPHLWYLEYRGTLLQLGGRELRLLPGFFVFNNTKGELIGLACIHVDDTRYTGSAEAEPIWEELHRRLRFGKKRLATDGWTKFCGRFEKQHPATFEMEYDMHEYCTNIPLVTERKAEDMERPLEEHERKAISSVVGQLAWAARQCRPDLSYGCSHVQQLAGQKDLSALTWLNKVVRRSQQFLIQRIKNLGCDLEQVVFLSVSDAAYAAQPNGGSQGGLLIGVANPNIQDRESPMVILETQSSRLQRVVRCSMAAELSMAATAYEHGDYVRAVFAEIMRPNFRLAHWKMLASQWRHILVLDAKVAYDALRSETAPTDRKLIVDIAVLREALEDEAGHGFVRWVPGREIPGDGLTKWSANGSLEAILFSGKWSLTDNEVAAELRRRVADRKRKRAQSGP